MRAPGVRWAFLARRLRDLRALGLLRTMVVETALAWGFFLGRPLRLPGLGVRGPPWVKVFAREWRSRECPEPEPEFWTGLTELTGFPEAGEGNWLAGMVDILWRPWPAQPMWRLTMMAFWIALAWVGNFQDSSSEAVKW